MQSLCRFIHVKSWIPIDELIKVLVAQQRSFWFIFCTIVVFIGVNTNCKWYGNQNFSYNLIVKSAGATAISFVDKNVIIIFWDVKRKADCYTGPILTKCAAVSMKSLRTLKIHLVLHIKMHINWIAPINVAKRIQNNVRTRLCIIGAIDDHSVPKSNNLFH